MSAVEIVLKYSLIVVIYSVIVLGSNEVKSDGAQSNKTEIAKSLNSTGKLMTEAGVIPLEDGHTAPIKSRKRPPLKYYPSELAKSESSKSNFEYQYAIPTHTTIIQNIYFIPDETKNNISNNTSSTTSTSEIVSVNNQKSIKNGTSIIAASTAPSIVKISSTTPSTTTVKVTTSKPTVSTISSTTKTTTTTQKPIPKKPLIAINAADNPDLIPLEKKVHRMPAVSIKESFLVEEPVAELSQEKNVDSINNSRYIMYVILVVGLPSVMIAAALGYRRFREHWHTRQYRRVDFLVDGMYAD